MLLDPINAITSVDFYRKVAKQSVGRSVAYLAYLSLVLTLALVVALKIKVAPAAENVFKWLETSMPKLTFQNGKLAANPPEAVTIRHPDYETAAVTIDTERTAPVTAEDLKRNKVSAYLTSDTLYLMPSEGDVRVHHFAKAAAQPGQPPVVIDAAFYRELWRVTKLVIYPTMMVIFFALIAAWTVVSTTFYTLVALVANSIAEAGLEAKALFNIALYAQTLITVLHGIFLYMPVGLPAPLLVSMASTTAYIWLAVKRNAPAQTVAVNE